MGNFNPHNPEILGVEWVPFAERMRVLDIGTEIGYGFAVTGLPNTALQQINLLTNLPEQSLNGSTLFYSVYPQGREDDTGEINVIRFFPSTVAVTGVVITGGGTAANAISNAGDATYLQFDSTSDQIRVNYSISSAIQGKRILKVDLIYATFGTPGYALYPTLETNTVVYPYGTFTGPANLLEAQEENLSFGEVNPWWALLGGVGPNTNSSRFPFRYDELVLLQTNLFVGVKVNNLPLSGVANLSFLALDVYYCEESRVRYGGQALGQDPTGNLTLTLPSTTYQVPLRTPSFAASGTMSAGQYTVTVTQADAGDKYNTSGIKVPELTQAYEISTHPGVQVTKFKTPVPPAPLVPPFAEPTDQIVACGLVDLGSVTNLQAGEAAVTYCDVYGAPVYVGPTGTSVTATQGIHNEAIVGNTTYEWIRFYARRFTPTAQGDLTVSVSGTGSAVITAADFAALDEITQGDYGPGTGWKEVTLPITAVFTSDGSFRNVTYTMTGVSTGNVIDQYQILTAGLTIPPDYINFTSYPSARYDGLQNADSILKTPNSGAVAVTSSQYTLVTMVSQASPAITGLALSTCTIPVSGVALRACSADPPACIPTHILGNNIAWNSGSIISTFRTVAVNSWPNADTGQAWTAGGGVASDYQGTGSVGTISLGTVNSIRRMTVDTGYPRQDITAYVSVGVTASGGGIEPAVLLRLTDANNYYYASANIGTNGVVVLQFKKRVVSSNGTIAGTYSVAGSHSASDTYGIRAQIDGSRLRAKIWRLPDTEPADWQLTVWDWDLLTGNLGGVRAFLESTNTNPLPVVFSWDNITMLNGSFISDTMIEIQRNDRVEDEWQTIYEAPLGAASFCDFEARAGMASDYRIRAVNPLDFAGPWASGSAYLPSPAVSGIGDGNSVLIFTSNQDTAASLAYVMQFDGEPVEEFSFPEAGQVQYRTQYQKDFFTAFHGTERGGEVFTRDILVHNAAITAPSLANFKGLRDLAWDALPYVCVRDELGNRWFASVSVPQGRVRSNRTVYIAQVQITEVTDTAAPYTGETS